VGTIDRPARAAALEPESRTAVAAERAMTSSRHRAGQPRARGGKGGGEPRLCVRRREHQVVELATAGHSQHAIGGPSG
jgi:hypothetical protein